MERLHTNLRLIHEKGIFETNNLNINNGVFQGDSLSILFCIDLIFLPIDLKNTAYRYKTIIKKMPHLFYRDDLNLKNDDDLENHLKARKKILKTSR